MLIKTDFNEKVMNRCSLFDLIILLLSMVGVATLVMDWIVVLNLDTGQVAILTGLDFSKMVFDIEPTLFRGWGLYIPTVCIGLSAVMVVLSGIRGISELVGYNVYRAIMVAMGAVIIAVVLAFMLWFGIFEQYEELAFMCGFSTWSSLALGIATVLYGIYSRPYPRGEVEWKDLDL